MWWLAAGIAAVTLVVVMALVGLAGSRGELKQINKAQRQATKAKEKVNSVYKATRGKLGSIMRRNFRLPDD